VRDGRDSSTHFHSPPRSLARGHVLRMRVPLYAVRACVCACVAWMRRFSLYSGFYYYPYLARIAQRPSPLALAYHVYSYSGVSFLYSGSSSSHLPPLQGRDASWPMMCAPAPLYSGIHYGSECISPPQFPHAPLRSTSCSLPPLRSSRLLLLLLLLLLLFLFPHSHLPILRGSVLCFRLFVRGWPPPVSGEGA